MRPRHYPHNGETHLLSTSGSPSDLQKEAVKTILVQASMFFAEWVELPQASRNPSIPCQAR